MCEIYTDNSVCEIHQNENISSVGWHFLVFCFADRRRLEKHKLFGGFSVITVSRYSSYAKNGQEKGGPQKCILLLYARLHEIAPWYPMGESFLHTVIWGHRILALCLAYTYCTWSITFRRRWRFFFLCFFLTIRNRQIFEHNGDLCFLHRLMCLLLRHPLGR